ncbi:DUF1353 domain-containing protein [Pseudoalteromonas sp. CNC9-20]|uniref:DUF1353 domain-containing protein n=1 Tax=Pseudoalteromonas sp. CNC9-20 TaxID=2917750 RepID=UPI001EF4D1D8|nr:DUF1353 domain-containing protein [Pseudoalteromonas sp. CNC9-20]MCG7570558.1 DUF1353 domain-containing protein [Pseudoalteromonas sp. CNC9-20]
MSPKHIQLAFIGVGVAQLLHPLRTQFGVVHRGFVTDGFTLPWYLRWFHNPFGCGLDAAIWHDFALKTGRKQPHKEFYVLLSQAGVPAYKAFMMRVAVTVYQKLSDGVHAIPKLF